MQDLLIIYLSVIIIQVTSQRIRKKNWLLCVFWRSYESTMDEMAHFSFPYYFTISNSELRILNSEICTTNFGIRKCQGGNKYALPITVKFDQSTKRFSRISFARMFKLTKNMALLFYLLLPYLLSI